MFPATRIDGNLAFLDLEMTGLDPERDFILQAALVITTRELETIEELCCDVWQPESALAVMSPFVRDMHEKNGLIERVRASRIDAREAERQLLARITARCAYPAILCGSSVWVDRMPGLCGYLHYRMLDVTSVRLFVERLLGSGAVYQKPTEGEHDALVDTRNSIAELRHYRALLAAR
jgi:oligoribonuclease